MEGVEFSELVGGLVNEVDEKGSNVERVGNLDRFKEIVADLKVLARARPEDKYLLVTGLQNLGSIVGVGGDGTNDAPALKKADVGFAMGISCTEIANAASDVLLLDDNFSSIITAILWGRNCYPSIRKFLQFQLTISAVVIFVAFLGGVVTGESPLTSIQMLWINLIMDLFAAIALATEPPTPQKPDTKNESLVTPTMWRNIIGQSFF